MSEPLRLRVPTPARGPLATEHSWRHVRPAGEMPKPPLAEKVERLAAYRKHMVRVLDDDGHAVGEWAPDLTPEQLIAGLTDMVRMRALDMRMLRAHRQGKISFYAQSLGEEAVACAQRKALRDDDMHFPTYRQPGLLVAGGFPLVTMIDQVLSNDHDIAKGRQLPVFHTSKEHGFFSISGNLGTQFVQAVGWAMASALQGDTRIASAWIGEGATAESDFHSALLFASTYQAPVILNVVNNQWAISTPEAFARGAAATFADRGFGFSIPSIRVDGNDYLAVYAASAWAAERARANLGPTLIEWVTLRAGAHSTSDDPSVYRPPGEIEDFPLGDPIERLRTHLTVLGAWDDAHHADLLAAADAEVEAALAEAESHGSVKSGRPGSPAAMFDDVYADMPRHLVEQRAEVLALYGDDPFGAYA